MRRQIKGQPALPGLEAQPSLAQLLDAEAAGINPQDYAALDQSMLDYAAVPNLRASLIDVDIKKGRSVLWYRPAPRGGAISVAVNPEDYNQGARSAEHLGKAVVNQTLERYPEEDRYLPEKQAAADRAGVHAVENKLGEIKNRLEEIHHRRELLDVLHEMSERKRYNLRRSYAAREQFHELMGDVIGDMVNAVGIQRRYNEDSMALMRRSIEARLYVSPQNVGKRVEYFNQLSDLGIEYYGHLVVLFAQQHYAARQYIKEHSQ